MNVTHDTANIKLTAGEISELFNTYLNNSASIYVLTYFLEKAVDPEIKSVISMSLASSQNMVAQIAGIFNSINHPVPKGFSAEDVNPKAQCLYSDKFMLTFIRYMARFGLTNYGEARASSVRADVRAFFDGCINSTMQILNQSDEILLSKGLYMKEPSIPIPDKIDFVLKQSFMSGFFGEQRPLNASEINRLYLNHHRNSLGKAFLIGLIQTTKNTEIKDYLMRGKNIAEKHMHTASSFLEDEDLPVPMSLDSEVTTSTETVFSDKLIIFYVVGLNALGIGTNGISLSRVMRRDISLAITRFITEIALYAEDGFNIMIDKEWFERMPEAADRKELRRK